jgi:hypothetical protein
MTRIAVILCAFLAACDVGDVSGEKPTDANGGGKMDGSGSSNACVNQVTPPPTSHTHAAPVSAGNPSNAGLNCLQVGCHAAGGAGGQFYFAGTAYTTQGGTTPAKGATVRMTFGGQTVSAITDDQGNFSWLASPVTFPAMTDITSCPTITAMINGLATGQGGCNSCHTNPASTTTTIGIQ